MHDTDETSYEKRARAGLIPYIRGEDGVYRYLMMVSSDPKFGGPRPMISKGKIEEGESDEVAAVREAEEELGLKQRNIRADTFVHLTKERVILHSGTYTLTLFAGEIIDKYDFDKWCDETEYTEWHTLESFKENGRRDHIKFVERLEDIIRKHHEPHFKT